MIFWICWHTGGHPVFRQGWKKKRDFFPETALENPGQKPVYTTRMLSLEEMDAAVEYEAGLRR